MRYRSYRSAGMSPVWIIIGINFLLYVVTIIVPETRYFLGLKPIDGFLSQPWGIVTNMFVHAGFWHLFANMLTLYFFGTAFENMAGGRRFLLVYFGGGIVGSILLLLLSPFFPFTIAIGASGAVFAIAGSLVMLAPKLRVFVFPIPAPIPLWAAVIGGFLILSFLPGVAWQAHLGGLIVGLIAGHFLRKRGRYFIL